MTADEVREAIRAGKAREAADPHALATYLVAGQPATAWEAAQRNGHIVIVCRCGWRTNPQTRGRAFGAWTRHHDRNTEDAR